MASKQAGTVDRQLPQLAPGDRIAMTVADYVRATQNGRNLDVARAYRTMAQAITEALRAASITSATEK